jgi:hypothetical protein
VVDKRGRKIPKPFQRPAINLDHHGKVWQTVAVESVRVDDIMTGLGRVRDVLVGTHVVGVLVGDRHDPAWFDSDQQVRVFGVPR